MPTPGSDDWVMLSPPPEHNAAASGRATCPPEEVRVYSPRSNASNGSVRSEIVTDIGPSSTAQQPSPPAERRESPSSVASQSRKTRSRDDGPLRDTPSPMSADDDCEPRISQSTSSLAATISSPSLYAGPHNSPFPSHRFRPNSTSSFLHHGSKFHGTQKSDRQEYDVQVEIKYVDIEESFLCGYLRIQGLTDDHPTLTTYFEGEIIGTKYTFQTRHEEWGSNAKVDMQHWARFPAWLPLAKQAKRSDFSFKNFAQRENIFMRWKEYFLVPDHRVKTISGASFEGFYYICFNQVQGTISGIYFHAKSEKYQQLELKHVPDNGCMTAIEFR